MTRQLTWDSLKLPDVITLFTLNARTVKYVSEDFTTKLKEIELFRPTLLKKTLYDIIKKIKLKVKKDYKNVIRREIFESVYTEDLLIYVKNGKDLQYNIKVWRVPLQNGCLKITVDRTKTIIIGIRKEKMTIEIDGTEIKHLGMARE